MTPRQAFDIERMPPGDRGPALRALLARFTARREAALARGPDLRPRHNGALAQAGWAIRKVRSVATKHGVDLGRDDVEVAHAGLTGPQRRALAEALADPITCRQLADACLYRHSLGITAHA